MLPEQVSSLLTRRRFLQGSALAAALAGAGFYWQSRPRSRARGRVVVVGGGAAGLSIAARLARMLAEPDITLIDPATVHDYQPGYTMIAAGVFRPEEVRRPMRSLMPEGVKWLAGRVESIDARQCRVHVAGGPSLSYDCLVLAPGLEMHFDAIEGIRRERLGQGNVHCIYDYASACRCWSAIQQLAERGGRALFTDTWTKVKCGGAPKKICFIAEDHARRAGRRRGLDIRFFTAVDHVYDIQPFRRRLEEIFAERGIPVEFEHRVKAVDTGARRVTLERRAAGGARAEQIELEFDFLHIVPPMTAPRFVIDSGLTADEKTGKAADWIPADPATLHHPRHANILVAGDAAGLPTSKTAAAIRMQAPVAAANVIATLEGRRPEARYDGYAACPFITEYGKVLMAEFDYTKKPRPTLPWLDPGREHRAGWILKRHVLKPMYFHLMLRGLA